MAFSADQAAVDFRYDDSSEFSYGNSQQGHTIVSELVVFKSLHSSSLGIITEKVLHDTIIFVYNVFI